MAALEVKDIYKSFESASKNVLQGVSLAIQDREFVSVLGPSGCGKSTLLRIMAGLEVQTSGHILIDHKDVSEMAPAKRDIAFVFQSYALYPHFTVFENIALGLKLRKVAPSEIQARIEKTCEMLELTALLKRKPKQLSGGQMQRVALARALVRNPKAFFLDEPLSNLDAQLREKTRSELKLLFKKINGTVVYVTHDQTEAMTLSDRIVLMKDGVVQQVGTPEEVYRSPANTFVGSFIGLPPMNIFTNLTENLLKSVSSSRPSKGEIQQVGIRPEEILIFPREIPGYQKAKVVLNESTGYLRYLTLNSEGLAPFKVSTLESNFSDVTEIWFQFPTEKLHFFNATGWRVDH
jgi:multiple sugar transport system ATP-binding protein